MFSITHRNIATGVLTETQYYNAVVAVEVSKKLKCGHAYENVRFKDDEMAGDTTHCILCEPNWLLA